MTLPLEGVWGLGGVDVLPEQPRFVRGLGLRHNSGFRVSFVGGYLTSLRVQGPGVRAFSGKVTNIFVALKANKPHSHLLRPKPQTPNAQAASCETTLNPKL